MRRAGDAVRGVVGRLIIPAPDHVVGEEAAVGKRGERLYRAGDDRFDADVALATGELAHLAPAVGTPAHRQCRFWMHYAEGSLMNWLVMKLVFASIPKQPMPFFVRPVAKALCATVQSKLIDPNVDTALDFMVDHLATHQWFAGEHITMADFQMSFAVEAALARANPGKPRPHLQAYLQRMQARPAYQRGIAKGGPVVMSA